MQETVWHSSSATATVAVGDVLEEALCLRNTIRGIVSNELVREEETKTNVTTAFAIPRMEFAPLVLVADNSVN